MKPKDLLPAARLVAPGFGSAMSVRDGRGPRAVVTLHAAGCPGCLAYLRTLAAASAAAAEWGGRFIAVVPGPPAEMSSPAGLRVLFDPEGVIADGGAAGVAADEWGEVYFATEAGSGHELPSADALVDWMRFAAIQCPECENPEGEWRTV